MYEKTDSGHYIVRRDTMRDANNEILLNEDGDPIVVNTVVPEEWIEAYKNTKLYDGVESFETINNLYYVDEIRKFIKNEWGINPTDKAVESFYNKNQKNPIARDLLEIKFRKNRRDWAKGFDKVIKKLRKKRNSYIKVETLAPFIPISPLLRSGIESIQTGVKSIANIFLDDENEFTEQSKAIDAVQTAERAKKMRVDEDEKKIKGLKVWERVIDGMVSGVIPDDLYQDVNQTSHQLASFITPVIMEMDEDGALVNVEKNPDYIPELAHMFKEGLYNVDETTAERFASAFGDFAGILASFWLTGKALPINTTSYIMSGLSKIKNPKESLRTAVAIEKLLAANKVEEAKALIETASKGTKAIRLAAGTLGAGVDDAVHFTGAHLMTSSSSDASDVAMDGFLFGTTGHVSGQLFGKVLQGIKNPIANKAIKSIADGTTFAIGDATVSTVSGAKPDETLERALEGFGKGLLLSLVKSTGSSLWRYGVTTARDRTIKRALAGENPDLMDKVSKKVNTDGDFILDTILNENKKVEKVVLKKYDDLLKNPDGSENADRRKYLQNLTEKATVKRQALIDKANRIIREKKAKSPEEAAARLVADIDSGIFKDDIGELFKGDPLEMDKRINDIFDKYAGNEEVENALVSIVDKANEVRSKMLEGMDIEEAVNTTEFPDYAKKEMTEFLDKFTKDYNSDIGGSEQPSEPHTEDFSHFDTEDTPNKESGSEKPSEVSDDELPPWDIDEPNKPTKEPIEEKPIQDTGKGVEKLKVDDIEIEFEHVESSDKGPLARTRIKDQKIFIQDDITGDRIAEYLNSEHFGKMADVIKNKKKMITNIREKYGVDLIDTVKKMDPESAKKFLLLHEYRHTKQIEKYVKQGVDFNTRYNEDPVLFEEDATVYALKKMGIVKPESKPMPEVSVKYTPKGKKEQVYVVKDGNIYNKKGKIVFAKESKDRKTILDLAKKESEKQAEPKKDTPKPKKDSKRGKSKADQKLLELLGKITEPPTGEVAQEKEFQEAAKLGLYKFNEVGRAVVDEGKVKKILKAHKDAALAGKLILSSMGKDRNDLLWREFAKINRELRKNLPKDILKQASELFEKLSPSLSHTQREVFKAGLLSDNNDAHVGVFIALKAIHQHENIMSDIQVWERVLDEIDLNYGVNKEEIPGFITLRKKLTESYEIRDRGKKFSMLYKTARNSNTRKEFFDNMDNIDSKLKDIFANDKDLLTKFYNFIKSQRENSKYMRQVMAQYENGKLKLTDIEEIDPTQRSRKSSALMEKYPGKLLAIKVGIGKNKEGDSIDIQNMRYEDQVKFFSDMMEKGWFPLMSHGSKTRIYFAQLHDSIKLDNAIIDGEFNKIFGKDAKKLEKAFEANIAGGWGEYVKDPMLIQKAFAVNQAIYGHELYGVYPHEIFKNVIEWNKRGQIVGSMGDYIQKGDLDTPIRKIHNLSLKEVSELFNIPNNKELEIGFDGKIIVEQELFDKLAELFGESNATTLKIFHHDTTNDVAHGTKSMWSRALDEEQAILKKNGIEILSCELNSKYSSGKREELVDLTSLRFLFADHVPDDINKEYIQLPSQMVNYIWNTPGNKKAFNAYMKLVNKEKAKYAKIFAEAKDDPEKLNQLLERVFGKGSLALDDLPQDVEVEDINTKNATEEMIKAFGANEFIINLPMAKQYAYQAITRYIFNKVIKPTVPGVISISRGAGIWSGRIGADGIRLGDSFKNKKVRYKNKNITLTEAVELWKDPKNRNADLEEALTVTVVRTPQENISGARRVFVEGFLGDKTGVTIALGKKQMDALGGADSDGDKMMVMFKNSISKPIREMFDKYQDWSPGNPDAEIAGKPKPESLTNELSMYNINSMRESLVGNINAAEGLEKVAGSAKFFNMLAASKAPIDIPHKKTPKGTSLNHNGVNFDSRVITFLSDSDPTSFLVSDKDKTTRHIKQLLMTKQADGAPLIFKDVMFIVPSAVNGSEAFVQAFTELKSTVEGFNAKLAMVTPKAYEAGYAGRELYTVTEDGDRLYYRVSPKAHVVSAFRDVMKATNGDNADFHVAESYSDMRDKIIADADEVWNLSKEPTGSDKEINLVDHVVFSYMERNNLDEFKLPDREVIDDVFKFYIRSYADAGKFGGMPPWNDVEAEIYSKLFNNGKFLSHIEGTIFAKAVDERGTQKELREALKAITSGKGMKKITTPEGSKRVMTTLSPEEIYEKIRAAVEKRGEPATGLEAAIYNVPEVEFGVLDKIGINEYLVNVDRIIKQKARDKVTNALEVLQKYGLDKKETVDVGVEKISRSLDAVSNLFKVLPRDSEYRDALASYIADGENVPEEIIKQAVIELREQTNDLILNDVYKTAAQEMWRKTNKNVEEILGENLYNLNLYGKKKLVKEDATPEQIEAIDVLRRINEDTERISKEFKELASKYKKRKIPQSKLEKIKADITLYAPNDKFYEDYYYFKFFDPIKGFIGDLTNETSAASRVIQVLPFFPTHISRTFGKIAQETLNGFKKVKISKEVLDADKDAGTLNFGINPVQMARTLRLTISKGDKEKNFLNAVSDFFENYENIPKSLRYDPALGNDTALEMFYGVTGIDPTTKVTSELIRNGMTTAQKRAFYDYVYTIGLGKRMYERVSNSTFKALWKRLYKVKLPATIMDKLPIGKNLVMSLELGIGKAEALSSKATNILSSLESAFTEYSKETNTPRKEVWTAFANAMNSKEGYTGADPKIRAMVDIIKHSRASSEFYEGNLMDEFHHMMNDTRVMMYRNTMRILDYKLKHASKYDIASFLDIPVESIDDYTADELNAKVVKVRDKIVRSLDKGVGYIEYYYPHKTNDEMLSEFALTKAMQEQMLGSGLVSGDEYASNILLNYESANAKHREREAISHDPVPIKDLSEYFSSVTNAYQHNVMLDAFLKYNEQVSSLKEISPEEKEGLKWLNGYIARTAIHAFGYSNNHTTVDNLLSMGSSIGFTVVATSPISSAHNFTQRWVPALLIGTKLTRSAMAWSKGDGKGGLTINGRHIAKWEDVSSRIGVEQGTMTDLYANQMLEDMASSKMGDLVLLQNNELYKEQIKQVERDFKQGKINKETRDAFTSHFNKLIEKNLEEFNEESYSKKAADAIGHWVEAIAEGRILPRKDDAGLVRRTLGKQVPIIKHFMFKSIEVGNRLFAGKLGYYQAYKMKARELERNYSIFEKKALNDIARLKKMGVDESEIPDKDEIIAKDMHELADKAGIAGAVKMISYTQFDYHGWNTPEWLRTPAQKMFFQFKGFIAHQLNMFDKLRQDAVKQHKVGLYEEAYGRAARVLFVSSTLFLAESILGVTGTAQLVPLPLADELSNVSKLLLGDEDAFYGKGVAGVPLYFSSVPANILYDSANLFYLANYRNDKLADRRLTKKFGILAQLDNIGTKAFDWRYLAPQYGYRWMATLNRTFGYWLEVPKHQYLSRDPYGNFLKLLNSEYLGFREEYKPKKKKSFNW